MYKNRIAVSAMIMLFWISLASAQQPGEERLSRMRVRENINRLRLLRMTEVLDLTEEQTAKIYPLATRVEKEKVEIAGKMAEEIRGLAALVESENPDRQEMARKVQAIKELRRAVQEKDAEFDALLEENLNDVQKAKYLIFTVNFYRGLREKLDRTRETAGQKRKQ